MSTPASRASAKRSSRTGTSSTETDQVSTGSPGSGLGTGGGVCTGCGIGGTSRRASPRSWFAGSSASQPAAKTSRTSEADIGMKSPNRIPAHPPVDEVGSLLDFAARATSDRDVPSPSLPGRLLLRRFAPRRPRRCPPGTSVESRPDGLALGSSGPFPVHLHRAGILRGGGRAKQGETARLSREIGAAFVGIRDDGGRHAARHARRRGLRARPGNFTNFLARGHGSARGDKAYSLKPLRQRVSAGVDHAFSGAFRSVRLVTAASPRPSRRKSAKFPG